MRFWLVRNMGQVFVAILVRVCSIEAGQLQCMAMERLANFSDEVTEGRGSVRAEEERVEREVWMVNSCSTSKHLLSPTDGDRKAEGIEENSL